MGMDRRFIRAEIARLDIGDPIFVATTEASAHGGEAYSGVLAEKTDWGHTVVVNLPSGGQVRVGVSQIDFIERA